MKKETDNLTELADLQSQLKMATDSGALSGDLTTAVRIKAEIEVRMKAIKAELDPLNKINPYLRELIDKKEVEMIPLMIGGASATELLDRLKLNQISVAIAIREMMTELAFPILPQPKIVNVIALRAENLNLTKTARIDKLFERAFKLGLSLCPAEVGPYFRLNCLDQPYNDWLHVAVEALDYLKGKTATLAIGHSSQGLCINGPFADSMMPSWLLLDKPFVFCLPT